MKFWLILQNGPQKNTDFRKLLGYQFSLRSLLTLVILISANIAVANCPKPFISSAANNFGVVVCSSPSVTIAHQLHAEKVLHKLLDYNNDMIPDNEKVLNQMISNQSIFLVLKQEEELVHYESRSGDHFNFAVVYQEEMVLDDAEQFDATIEEALHLITAEGYSKVYPEFFGEFKGSQISVFLDEARGGYFASVPRKYPAKAYFTYYDKTCDYGCQITEFLYWSISTLRGQQKFNWRDYEIENEWRPETSDKLQTIAPKLVKFLSREEFSIYK